MLTPPKLENEEEIIENINAKNLLNNDSNNQISIELDKITKLALEKLKVPISTISIIYGDKEMYKSCIGIPNIEIPKALSFCGHAIADSQLMIVEDTLNDERFKDNPYVIGEPYIRFYCGIKLIDRKNNIPLAVFCIKDKEPRQFSTSEIATFIELSQKAEDVLNQ